MTSQDGAGAPRDSASSADPFLRVVSGNPSDEDIAALVAVLSAAASADAGPAEPPVIDQWGRPSTMHRPGTAFSPYSFTTGVTAPR